MKFTTEYATYLEDEFFEAGEHEIEKPTKDQVRLLTDAHAAGMLVVEGLPAVDADEDAQAARLAAEAADYAAAQGEWQEGGYDEAGRAVPSRWSGAWHDGNEAQHAISQAQKAVAAAEASGDEDEIKAAAAQYAEAEKLVANLGGEA